MELFAKIVNGFQVLIIFAKSSFLDICQVSKQKERKKNIKTMFMDVVLVCLQLILNIYF